MPHWNTFTTNAGCDIDFLTRNATIKVIETAILYFTLFGMTKYLSNNEVFVFSFTFFKI